MELGIYEQIINKLFQYKIDALDSDIYYIGKNEITRENAVKYLSRYLYRIIEQMLIALPNDTVVEKSVSIVNSVINHIAHNFNLEDFQDNLLSAQSSILTAVIDRTKVDYPDAAKYVEDIMPSTKLTDSELFTGRNGEVNMVSELKKEISSSDEICLIVSFIKKSGLNLIKPELQKYVLQGKKLRVITTTYTQATDYQAIVELAQMPNTTVKISYNGDVDRLHAKAYLFLRNSQFHTAYIGSSNISAPALTTGMEWNIKVTQSELPHIISMVRNTFETYWNDETFETFVLGRDNERLKQALNKDGYKTIDYSILDLMKAKDYQTEVLDRLTVERNRGHNKNLVVAATGTGKTVIAAFDYKRFKEENKRANFLFVAHREEIIKQARNIFRQVLNDENFGDLWYGGCEAQNYTAVFASKDTLNNRIDNMKMSSDYYDYIIIDEAHHISVPSYQKIYQKFTPKILLGLTATPERMDRYDITDYFDGRISAEIRLTDALNNSLLSPFRYYGVTDSVDLSKVKWERGRFVPSELSKVYTANDRRTSVIFKAVEKYLPEYNNTRALCFCVDKEHAQYMSSKFQLAGLSAGILTSDNSYERTKMIRRLESKNINYLFVVDMLNEGVDIPSIDAVLFLRPTESLTIFLQQLGRGLRKSVGKEFLTVLDFVGNSRAEFNFMDRFRALIGRTSMGVREEILHGFPHLPFNCHIELEEQAKEYILRNIEANLKGFNKAKIINKISTFEKEHNKLLTLKNFVEVYKLSLSKIYNKSTWTTLCIYANVIPEVYEPLSKELSRAVLKKWQSTSSESYFLFIQSLAKQSFKIDYNNLTLIEKKMSLMFYYDIFQEGGQFSSLQLMFDYLSKQKEFISEVREIMDILLDNCNVLERNDNSSISYMNPLKLHARYTRNQISAALGTSTLEKKSPSREGVERQKDLRVEAMFVDIIKDREIGSNTNYNDYAINNDLFHWESQNSVHSRTKSGENYINSTQTMLLFVREQDTFPEDKSCTLGYVYLGEVRLVQWEDGKPMKIIWKLKTPMPAYVHNFACKYKAIG